VGAPLALPPEGRLGGRQVVGGELDRLLGVQVGVDQVARGLAGEDADVEASPVEVAGRGLGGEPEVLPPL
jgi:hypothetical protein